MTQTAWLEPTIEAAPAVDADTAQASNLHADHTPQRFGGPAAHLAEWGNGARGLSQRVAATIAAGRSVSPGQNLVAARPAHAAVYGMPPREVMLTLDPIARLRAHLAAVGAQAAASIAVLALPMIVVAWAASGLWHSGQIDTDPASVNIPATEVEQNLTRIGAVLSEGYGSVPAQPGPVSVD